MGASPLMSLGIRAMAANYAALQATGHNIANASVAGYSRQTAEFATAQGQFTGAGFFGRGVDVTSVTRAHDAFLTRETANAGSLAAMDSARLTQLQRLEAIFKPGETGLGYATSQLFDAMVDLSSQPTDLATRQVVLARAGDLAQRFAEAGSSLDIAQASVTSAMKTAVAEVNQLTQGIASANQRIAALQGSGQSPNDLLDERDRLISRLSELVQVSRITADDGTVGLFIGGGQRLVLGAQASTLAVTQDSSDPSRSALALNEGGQMRAIESSVLGGGSIAGLIRYQNEDLVDGRNLVGQLAAAVGGALNTQQLRGLNLQAPLGTVASQPLFQMGQPQALAQAGNARDGANLPIGSVGLTLVDPGALQASDYDLRESTTVPGSWQLTRLSDGAVSTVNSGDVVDGMRIDINNPQAGDRFLLQPVARAANGMTRLLSDPRDIAAASPLLATTPAANTGTASVGELAVTAAPLPFPGDTEVITFTRVVPPVGADDYVYTSSLTGVSTPWHTGQPVVGGNGYTLTVSGVPADNDTVSVAPTPAGSMLTNNGNARALLALRDAGIVAGHTATDAWSEALADVGVRVQSGQVSADISGAVAAQAESTRSSQAGVNLDEEAARLIQFQQSYQAAAKVLQVAQALFDTLLQTAAGR